MILFTIMSFLSFFQLLYNRKLTPSLNRKRIGGRLIKCSETILSVNKYLFVGLAGSIDYRENSVNNFNNDD